MKLQHEVRRLVENGRARTIAVAALFALLGAACSQEGAQPVGPEGLTLAAPPGACSPWPGCQDDSGGSDTEPEYDIVITGDVTGNGQTSTETSGVIARGFPLDLSFLQGAVEGGGTCFDAGAYVGAFASAQQGDGSIDTAYFFEAKTKTGDSVKYNFKMLGTLGPGDVYPPVSGNDAVVTFTSWTLQHDSKGSKKTSCSGSGSLTATMTVTVVE